MMKKVLALALAGTLALAALSGCGSNSNSGGSATTTDTIKVGINMELSGGVASYGKQELEGIKLALEQINAAGGIKGKQVSLVEYDNKSEPAESTTLASRLIEQDKVIAIIGPATSGAFKAQIPVANKGKVAVVAPSATADDVLVDAKGNVQEYAFRICFGDTFQGVTMGNFAADKLSAKTAVVYKDSSSDYAKGLAENFSETFTAKGGTIVAEEAYVDGDTDFNAVLTSLKGKEFDVMYLPGYYEEVGLIVKQARALGITQPILGADGYEAVELIDLAGKDNLNDVYFTNHYSSLDQDPVVIKFIEDYKAKYSADPSSFNAMGYDAANFLFDAINRAEELTAESVQKAMAATDGFVGVTGKIKVNEKHEAVKSIVVIEMQNGEQVKSEKVDVD